MLLSLFHKRESWNWKRKGSPKVIQHVNGESKWRLRPSVMSLVKHLFCVYCSWLSCSSHPCPGGGLEDAGLGMKKLESQLEAVFFFFSFFSWTRHEMRRDRKIHFLSWPLWALFFSLPCGSLSCVHSLRITISSVWPWSPLSLFMRTWMMPAILYPGFYQFWIHISSQTHLLRSRSI